MANARILVVEDEFLLACSLEEDLRDAGFDVLGPFNNLYAAQEAAEREAFDAALLDVNLSGTMVYPLADLLAARGVPIVFLTGYGIGLIPPRFTRHPVIAKPVDPGTIDRALRRAIGARPG